MVGKAVRLNLIRGWRPCEAAPEKQGPALPALVFGRVCPAAQSMIPKKPAPDLIRGVQRFSEKLMLKQEAKARWRFKEKSSRFSVKSCRVPALEARACAILPPKAAGQVQAAVRMRLASRRREALRARSRRGSAAVFQRSAAVALSSWLQRSSLPCWPASSGAFRVEAQVPPPARCRQPPARARPAFSPSSGRAHLANRQRDRMPRDQRSRRQPLKRVQPEYGRALIAS